MPSPYSTERSELCRHDSFRVGCVSCKQHGVRGRFAESEAKLAKVDDSLRTLPSRISKAATDEERQILEKDKQKAKARHDRLLVPNPRTEPHMLAEAFEKDAAAREIEMNKVLDKGLGKERVKFETADPELEMEYATPKSSFKGPDLTNIPATPDYPLDDPVGLAVFLRSTNGKNPMSAMGPESGPAVMSYGRALAMFGPPETHTESTPKTEREFRERDTLNPPTVPILSEQQQWALFTEDKCLPYTELLVSEYTSRVKAKKNVGKADTTGSSDKKKSSSGGWPEAEGHNWAGLTNWIHRCIETDKKFFEVTLPTWKRQVEDDRATMIDRL
ncbi:hypothetical protein KCU65_g9778, partial [Aureobasidium melanogenum]